jgi:hypothetical protein
MATADTAVTAGLARWNPIPYAKQIVGEAPPWLVSLVVHVVVLAVLSLIVTNPSRTRQSVVTIDTRLDELITDEFTEVLTQLQPLPENVTLALTSSTASGNPAGTLTGGGPSASGSGGMPVDPARSAAKVPSYLVGLGGSALPGKLSMDRAMSMGAGGFKGEVDAHAEDTAAAMDRITREILRLLQTKKVLVIWLFDESLSMKDDQREVSARFDRVYEELGIARPDAGDAVETVIASFGKQTHIHTPRPTHELDEIRAAIDKIPVEVSGVEHTHQAVEELLARYSRFFTQGSRWIALVLVTDESGDDGGKVEEAVQVAKRFRTPFYILGRQSMFGKRNAILTWVDPETSEVFHPTIARGPESADVELLQFDGLHLRWDNQVSGFGPYELARLARDSGGIYFILTTEEDYGLGKAKTYDYLDLKQYVPEYIARREYTERRQSSEFRRTVYDIIEASRPEKIGVPGSLTIDPQRIAEQARAADLKAQASLQTLENVNKIVERLRPLRDHELSRRWQANYDLIAGQIPAYEVMLVEYRLLMQEIMKDPPKPTPTKDRTRPPTGWWLGHGNERRIPKLQEKAPLSAADKKLIDEMRSKEETARALLAKVVNDHAKTPWADRAQWELARGWGASIVQYNHHVNRASRAQAVPNF